MRPLSIGFLVLSLFTLAAPVRACPDKNDPNCAKLDDKKNTTPNTLPATTAPNPPNLGGGNFNDDGTVVPATTIGDGVFAGQGSNATTDPLENLPSAITRSGGSTGGPGRTATVGAGVGAIVPTINPPQPTGTAAADPHNLPPENRPTTPQQQEAVQLEQDAMAKYSSGDTQAAAKEIQIALQKDPGNERIKALSEIIVPHILTPMSAKTLQDRAGNLMAQRETSGVDGGAPAQALLATPIAWGVSKDLNVAVTHVPSPIEEFLKRDPAKEAVLKMRMKDFQGAEEALTKNLELNPLDWLSYRTRAMARRSLKKYQGSIDDATRALTINPKDGWSHVIRASDLTDTGNPKLGLEEAEAALKLNVDDASAYVARAQALERMNRDDDALVDLRRAAELDSQFKDLYRAALAKREGGLSNRPRLAYAAAALAVLLLLGGISLGRRASAPTRTTSRRTPMRAADQVERVPQGFTIVRTLGEGGMGIVYEALDKSLERPVALKKMRPEIAGDLRERRRLLKEARVVAALRHPNIVQIYSIVDEGPDLFLVFELLKGETLSSLVGKLEPRQAAEVVSQIASALDHAHAKGVIHRDLKPSNVLLAGDNAKVMDFGIARASLATINTTTRNEIVGTPPYMAPEQEAGEPTQASDVFSLGVCAYELLSGRLPFSGGGLMQKLKADYPRLSTYGQPPAVDGALARALHPEPGRRYTSAGDFARELARSLS